MAEPGQTAHGNRIGIMTRLRSHPLRIPAIMWVFSACCGALALACSDGESGLVLGRPPNAEGGAGTGGAAEPSPSGGQAGEPSVPVGGTPTVEPSGGAGGEAGSPPWDGWVEELCTPTVAFENQSPMGDGKAFDDAVVDPAELLWTATRAVCRTLFRSASDVPNMPEVSLTVGPYEGVAGTGDGAITLNAAYLKMRADAGQNLLPEISGILYFQASFLYQNAGRSEDTSATRWVRYGIADFVRLRGGYLTRSAQAPAANSWSTAGSQPVAFFFEYLSQETPDIVFGLNRRLAPTEATWSDEAFVSLTGKDLTTLWDEYRGTF